MERPEVLLEPLLAPLLFPGEEAVRRFVTAAPLGPLLEPLRVAGIEGLALLPGGMRRPFGITGPLLGPDTWEGNKLGELLGELKHCYPVALSRAGKSSLPEKDTILQAGDLLNVSSTLEGIGELTKRIAQKAEA